MSSKKESENHFQSTNFSESLILIADLDQALKIENESLAKQKEYIKKLQEERNKKLIPVQKAICHKKFTTGDKIKDFVIVFHHGDENTKSKYHELAINLKKHRGELVLVKEIRKEETPHLGPLKNVGWFEDFRLGVISQKAPEFNFKSGKISFTNGFLAFETGYLYLKMNSPKIMNFRYCHEKNYLLWLDHKYLNQPIEKIEKFDSMAIGIKDLKMIEIFVGDKEVKQKLQNYEFELDQIEHFFPIIAKHLKNSKT